MNTKSSSMHQGAGRKGVLFCPTCERSAPIDDGWPLDGRVDRMDVTCPNCEAVVLSQPRFDSSNSKRLIAA